MPEKERNKMSNDEQLKKLREEYKQRGDELELLYEEKIKANPHLSTVYALALCEKIRQLSNINTEIDRLEGLIFLTLDDYQYKAKATDLYPSDVRLVALLMGLANEAGEALGHYKKHLRGDEAYQDENALKTALIKEIGDTLWYLSGIADALGVTLSEVAQANLDKLASRYDRGVIKKSGDDR